MSALEGYGGTGQPPYPEASTSAEPTDFGGFTSASSEDEEPVSWLTYLLAAVAFLSILLVLGLSAGYWLHLF